MSSFGRVPKQQALFDKFTTDLQPGRLQWIGVRPARREPMITATEAQAVAGMGLTGDRRMQGSAGSGRQVTLIAAEHLDVIARLLHLDVIDPALVRRNLVVSGVNLNALRYQQFRVGDVVLESTELCHPCSRMDEVFGPGGQAAMLGHGGLCARILQGGIIRIGDAVQVLSPHERIKSH